MLVQHIAMHTKRLICRLSLMLVALTCATASLAGCKLPVADGGDERPSAPNLHGDITKVVGNEVSIHRSKTGRIVRIRLSESPEIYSAFGGDVSVSELAPGQIVWVWFKDCQWPKKGPLISAYFQIYSKDPQDRPKAADAVKH